MATTSPTARHRMGIRLRHTRWSESPVALWIPHHWQRGDTAGMGSCCEPSGYQDMFGARFSRHLARRYRKRGLDRTARRMVAFLAGRGVQGATVLEIGGGVGAVQIELLRRGAARATNLELVDSYD